MTNTLKYFIGNWKMFGDFNSLKIANQISNFSRHFKKKGKKYKVVLCVPHTLLNYFNEKLKSKFVSIGAQNCHYYQNYGPYTGSINANMIKKVGAKLTNLSDKQAEYIGVKKEGPFKEDTYRY